MSVNNDLTSSQINQSEAGPDIVEYSKSEQKEIMNNLDASEKMIKQPVNVVAPLKVESRGATQHVLEAELLKLQEIYDKQTQQRVADKDSQLHEKNNQLFQIQEKLRVLEERDRLTQKKLADASREQEQLTVVMQDYEMLIGKLTAEVEKDKELRRKNEQLEADKEAALGHLHNVEAAFSDVHSKYEKCKKVVEDLKKNEAKLKEVIAELRETVRLKEKTLENVQAHAASQLDAVQRELQQLLAENEQETTRLRAMLRRTELKVISLQESLDQKTKENQELTTICDDLIASKGFNSH